MTDMTEEERQRQTTTQAQATPQVEVLPVTDRLRAELLGTVSHELRSPLAAIKGYAATLLRHERRLPRQERHEFLLAIDEAADRLQVIIDRLLQMSELETGAIAIQHAAVDVEHLAREAIDAAEQRLSRSGTDRFTFSLQLTDAGGAPAASVPLVMADPRLLRNVLDNLLENAVKYSPDSGQIEMVIGPASSHAIPPAERSADASDGLEVEGSGSAFAVGDACMLGIHVRDHGMGIPAEHLGRIFDRFHRVDTRLTRDVDGLGLGLAICKRIVELHGGAIWAESVTGEGSTFHVLLPLDEASAGKVPIEEANYAGEEDDDSGR